MEAIAIFSIFCQAETYIFSLTLPTESPLLSQQAIHAPFTVGGTTVVNIDLQNQLNHDISATVAELRRQVSNEPSRPFFPLGGEKRGGRLERLGQFLFNFLLPSALQDALRDLPAELPIILTTNESKLPWELLHDGKQYLALKHPIGRSLWGTVSLRKPRPVGSTDSSLLLISNPTGDLEEADLETEELMDHIFDPELIGLYPELLARSHATKWKVLQELGKEVNIIHYSGHAKPGALLLADGELGFDAIGKALTGRPFVFLNACQSVRGASQDENSSLLPYNALMSGNLAEAFIRAGAIGFVGTLWPVFDRSSRQFAKLFYSRIWKGMSVGTALRQTREQMYQMQPDDPIWASFVLIGDPRLRITEGAKPESRLVTVLVARLRGILPLFERLGLEAAAEIRERYIQSLRQVAERYGGLFEVAGTELLKIYFGVPKAHDKDAEHAMLTAFDMISTQIHPLAEEGLSVGISTGRLLVRKADESVLPRASGDAFGYGYQIVGLVSELAVALAGKAGTAQIVIDEVTRRSVRSHFTVQLRERVAIATSTTAAYRVIGHLRRGMTASKLVGRTNELAQLHIWLNDAHAGHGRVVGIVGEPGIGKTRLLFAFRSSVQKDNSSIQWISAYSQTYEKSQSYSLLAKIIRALAGIEAHDEEARQREKLEQLIHGAIRAIPKGQALAVRQSLNPARHASSQKVGGTPTRPLGFLKPQGSFPRNIEQVPKHAVGKDKQALALVGRVLDLPAASPAVDNLEPELRQKKLSRVVLAIFKKATREPLVLALEDLQWADEASLAVLSQVVNIVGRRRLLLLATYRPDWSHDWGNALRFAYRNLPLDDLPEEALLCLLTQLLNQKPSQELTRAILTQTGGNPFVLEEYVWLLKEEGFLRGEDKKVADLSQILLPGRVERIIQARLDQLPSQSRQVIQLASVIGEKFEYELLELVLEKLVLTPSQEGNVLSPLEQELELLLRRHLIEEQEEWPYFLYSFSHGLLHQIVVNLLPERFALKAHRLVAQALLSIYDNEEEILSRLANHYYQSNDQVNAIRYSLKAAKQAAESWANQTALEWYGKAREKIQRFDAAAQETVTSAEETPSPTELIEHPQGMIWQIEALEGQAEVEDTIGHHNEAIDHLSQALELAPDLWPVTRLAALYRKLAIVYQKKGQFDTAQEALNKGLEVTGGLVCLEAGRLHIWTGMLHYRQGRLSDGMAECEQAIAIIEKTENISDLAQAYNLRGVLDRHLGDRQKAIIAFQRSIELYKQAEYLPGQERAYFNLGGMYKDLGKWASALACFDKSQVLSDRTGEARRQAGTLNGLGEIYRRQGKLDQAIEVYSEALLIVQELGSKEFIAVAQMNLGASYLKKELLNDAYTQLTTSREQFEEVQANVHLPEVLRYLAEYHLRTSEHTKAHHLAQEAIDWTLKQELRQEEGQVRRVLGQAYRELGELEEATAQLEKSLSILEERDNPYEVGLTLIELALLYQTQADAAASEQSERRLEQARLARCRAITILDELGAAFDLKRAQEIRLPTCS